MHKENYEIEPVTACAFDDHLMELAGLLNACVADGASVNFVLPHTVDDSLTFWSDKVHPILKAGALILLIIKVDNRIAGSVQLDCDTPPNQPHRAEVAKLLVHPDFRRRGIARKLMVEIENYSKRLGRNLITLDTASDNAEQLYLSLGYERAGIIPDYAKNPLEDKYDSTTIMFKAL